MIKDALLLLTPDAGQKLTAAAASANQIDLGQAAPTPGMNRILTVVFQVMEDIAGKISFAVQDCDTADGTYADVVKSMELDAPEAGTQVNLLLPEKCRRYIQAYFSGTATGGTVRAFITTSSDHWYAAKEAPSKQYVI